MDATDATKSLAMPTSTRPASSSDSPQPAPGQPRPPENTDAPRDGVTRASEIGGIIGGIAGFLTVVGGAAGYWYKRRKGLKEKQSRSEECE